MGKRMTRSALSRSWVGVALVTLALGAAQCGGDSPTGPSGSNAEQRFLGSVTRADGQVHSIDLSLFIQNLPTALRQPTLPSFVAPLLAQESTVDVTGNFTLTDGTTGSVQGTLTGPLSELRLVQGAFDGTLTGTAADGCVAERAFTGPITGGGLQWTAGGSVRTCPDDPLSFGSVVAPPAPTTSTPAPSVPSMAGDWTLTVQEVAPFCGQGPSEEGGGTAALSVTQSGATLMWIARFDEGVLTMDGSIDIEGSFRLSGIFVEDSGSPDTSLDVVGALAADGQSLSGNATNAPDTDGCVEQLTLTATRR